MSSKELVFFDNVIAIALRQMDRGKRLAYAVDDPDALADVVGMIVDAAAIRRMVIAERQRRKGEERPNGRSKDGDRDKGGEC